MSEGFNITDTTATKKIFGLRKRIRAVAGGTSASKTISILIWAIDYSQKQYDRPKLGSVVSESFPHLQNGAMLDFEVIMKDRGYWDERRWNKTTHIYTFETGNRIQFTSMDTYSKAHGGRRDWLFINEANYIEYKIADQLIVRTREVIWLDWNPTIEFWFYTEMLGHRDDIDFITLTYLDNEALDEPTKNEILSHKNNKQWWQVYGLGMLGEIEGRIYTGWKLIDDIPPEARLEKYGLDFGYSVDPTASDAIYKWNDSIIIDEVIHQKGLSNRQIAEFFLNLPGALVIADSAEPKSIDEIASYGVTIVPSAKGKDSINNGIQVVQDQQIFITKRSVNTLKEYRNYMWQKDKNDEFIKKPVEIWNHHMDDVRYAISSGEKRKVWVQKDPGGVKPLIAGTLA